MSDIPGFWDYDMHVTHIDDGPASDKMWGIYECSFESDYEKCTRPVKVIITITSRGTSETLCEYHAYGPDYDEIKAAMDT